MHCSVRCSLRCSVRSSALLSQPSLGPLLDQSLLLQVAFDLASAGRRVTVISKGSPKPPSLLRAPAYSRRVEVLERITFLSFVSGGELIRWCARTLFTRRPPNTLLLPSLDQFFSDSKSLAVCSALLDVLSYFALLTPGRSSYLTATLTDESEESYRVCRVLFDKVWRVKGNSQGLFLRDFCELNCIEQEICLRALNDGSYVSNYCNVTELILGPS